MKKMIAGLAAVASSGMAFSQSSVTIFGVMDVAVAWSSNKSEDLRPITATHPASAGSVSVSRTELQSGRLIPTRIGFRGTEDLGGGLAAGFWLEAANLVDTGDVTGQFFSRRSTVSLLGGLGELRVGRDYVPTFWNDSIFDPFGVIGAGQSLVYAANSVNPLGGSGGFGGNPYVVRASNSVGYFLPKGLGGFYGQAMYILNEQTNYDPSSAAPLTPNTGSAGRGYSGRFGYAAGKLDTGVAFTSAITADNPVAGSRDEVQHLSWGANYDLDFMKLFGQVTRVKYERTFAVQPAGGQPEAVLSGWVVGAHFPVGPGVIRVGYSRADYDLNNGAPDPKADKMALGYIHNLSRRTALYATVARVSNKNKAALLANGPAFVNNAIFTPTTSTASEFGIRSAF